MAAAARPSPWIDIVDNLSTEGSRHSMAPTTISLTFDGSAHGLTTEAVIDDIVAEVPIP